MKPYTTVGTYPLPWPKPSNNLFPDKNGSNQKKYSLEKFEQVIEFGKPFWKVSKW